MSIRGKVIAVGQLKSGNRKSDGQPWKKQEYVIETEGQYPKKVAFSIMNDRIDQANIQPGNVVEIEIDAQSREYNGRWYTELTAWKVNNLGYVQTPQNQQPIYQQTAPQGYAPSVTPTNQFGQPIQQTRANVNDEMPF